MKIAFLGVGKLGRACAEIIAESHEVVGYDINQSITPNNFEMAPTVESAIKGAEIIFIAVPTPHDPLYDGRQPTAHLPPRDFSYNAVIEVAEEVANFTQPNQTVVLISTVLPGTCRKFLGLTYRFLVQLATLGNLWNYPSQDGSIDYSCEGNLEAIYT